MHGAAMHYANRFGTGDKIHVIEFGSRDVNGTPRHLFPGSTWWGIDIAEGPAVDEVADAATWTTDTPADVVICMEVLEHTPAWAEIVENSHRCLKPGGRVVLTAAGPHRQPHSAFDGGPLRDGEHYGNIGPVELEAAMVAAGFTDVEVAEVGEDVQATGIAGKRKKSA